MPTSHPALLLSALITATGSAQQTPRTVAETSGYQQTSRAADVARFVEQCEQLPHGGRLAAGSMGSSHEGRRMQLVRASLPGANPYAQLRVVVIGNIHAGEVEGKEAVQELIREIAAGQHTELLERCTVWFVPIYNVDGNEAVKVGNRRGQNGPDAVGQRANGQGLDLNRDFVKADAPETRALLRLFDEVDPHLFVDLHTTNGSHHGYHLTYAPSLNPNVDPAVDRFSRDMLARTRRALRAQGLETFDYGNFETRDWDGGGAPSSRPDDRGWFTYDSRARYGINYFGLRNRLSVLSEAYSYADFETRIRATKAFVLGLLRDLVANEAAAHAAMRAADQRVTRDTEPVWFGTATGFAPPERLPVLVGKVDRLDRGEGLPPRYVRREQSAPETMKVVRRFRAAARRRLPAAWAILDPTPAVKDRLRLHGVEFRALDEETAARGRTFRVDKKRKPKRPYQGHQALVLEGAWQDAAAVTLPRGALLVPARQRRARVAATLLEPLSEDGLSTWNFFEDQTDETFPVLRLVALPDGAAGR
ncbi:MAG: M14 family metallopeptidase [Planctomycetota bacterium]|nr:M14 family metallopeptidase [Planctomycetota bacterium]